MRCDWAGQSSRTTNRQVIFVVLTIRTRAAIKSRSSSSRIAATTTLTESESAWSHFKYIEEIFRPHGATVTMATTAMEARMTPHATTAIIVAVCIIMCPLLVVTQCLGLGSGTGQVRNGTSRCMQEEWERQSVHLICFVDFLELFFSELLAVRILIWMPFQSCPLVPATFRVKLPHILNTLAQRHQYFWSGPRTLSRWSFCLQSSHSRGAHSNNAASSSLSSQTSVFDSQSSLKQVALKLARVFFLRIFSTCLGFVLLYHEAGG